MNVAQRAFSAGELSPSLYGRIDIARYHVGLRTCRNMIIQQDGGAVNRPGTMFIAEIKDSAATVRLIKFVNDTTTYIIELGEGYARFYRNQARISIAAPAAWVTATAYTVGDLVSQGGVNYYCFLAHVSSVGTDKPGVDGGAAQKWYALTGTIYEIPMPFTTAQLPDVQISQKNNVIEFVHPELAPRLLTKHTETRWILTSTVYGPYLGGPTGLALAGGVTGALTYWAVTTVRDNTFEESRASLISSTNKVPTAATPTVVTWNAVTGAVSYNVYRSSDGKNYGYLMSGADTDIARTDVAWGDNSETASASAAGVWAAAAGQLLNALAPIGALQKSKNGLYRVVFDTTLSSGAATTGKTEGRFSVYYKRNTDAVRVLAELVPVDFVIGALQVSGPTTESIYVAVPDDGYTSLEIQVQPEVKPGGGGSTCTFLVDATSGSVSWTETSGTFSDVGATPDVAIAQPTPFDGLNIAGRYPSVIAQFQQRRFYANSTNEPTTSWLSRAGNAKNFDYSTPLQADDPVVFEIDSRQANPIKHALDLGRLIIFTSTSELIAEGDQSGIVKPDAVNVRSHSYNGASKLPPVVIGNRALYVQARSSSVRSIRHDDAEGSVNTNLSVFASHLFRGKTLVDWDVALMPNSIVWVVRSDGVLLGLTFIPELDTWGWHRHDTDGTFENVCTVPESTGGNSEDVVYLVVRRTINGSAKRYIEYMPTRYYSTLGDTPFVDCGTRVAGPTASAAAAHLEAKNASIQSNGVVIASPNNPAYTVRTVTAGVVALGATYSNVVVGLPFTSDLVPMDTDTVEGGTLKQGRILASRLAIMVDSTTNLWAGLEDKPPTTASITGLQPFTTIRPEEDTAASVGTRMITPNVRWNKHGRLLIRQVDPVPTTILMLSPQINDKEP
jgi:hypothetical protein